MEIQTKRLQIRPILESDWERIRDIREDFCKSPYARYDRPWDMTDEAVHRRVARWAKANAGTEHLFFAVCLQGAMIGYIAFNRRAEGCEIGYCFHSAYAGKGYAGESHAALFAYLRGLGVKTLSAGTAIENLPSAALLRSLGFRQTETEAVSFYKDASGEDIVFEGGIFELNL